MSELRGETPGAGGAEPRLQMGPTEFEARWPPRLALAAAIALYATLPARVIPGPRLIVPALEMVVFLSLFVAAPTRRHSALPHVRAISIAMVGLVTGANIATLVLLCHELVTADPGSGSELIVAAIEIYMTNVIAFAFWYWELDRGGPAARTAALAAQRPPDFLFPQMTTPSQAAPGWRPYFVDYLFVSFTNATAFSPTDTMPLSQVAKLLFMVQSSASLITVALVAARAVNILH